MKTSQKPLRRSWMKASHQASLVSYFKITIRYHIHNTSFSL